MDIELILINSKPADITLNVLLADDDVDDRLFFSKALTESPIAAHLTLVHDGEQLMTYLFENSEQLPDVLFLDLSMPRKTGFECLSEIKEDDKLKGLPVVVFTTAFGRSMDFEHTMIHTLSNIGSLEYVRKPNDFEELKQVINRVLLMVREKKESLSSEAT